jgi:hypothetical protein
MKKLMFLSISILFLFAFTACNDDDTEVIVDSSLPQGTFTSAKSGTFAAQNDTPTAGMAQLGTDSEGVNFLRFTPTFTTALATGTVTVYFSKSATLMFNPGNGNPNIRIVGTVTQNGERFFKLNTAVPADFTHVILWCASAGIPFGNAPLN